MRLMALAAILLAAPALGQTCLEAPSPIPRDAVVLTWDPVLLWVEGHAIQDPSRVRYVVYELVAGVEQRVCTAPTTTAAILGLADGIHTWVVRATSPDSLPVAYAPSGPSNPWSKTILPAALPAGTRPATPTELAGN